MKIERFGLLGWYGHGNVGDDALLQAVFSQVHQACPESHIKVFCDFPEEVQRLFGYEAVSAPLTLKDWRTKPRTALRSLSAWLSVDALVLGGGGFFANDVSIRNVIKWSLYILFAKLTGKRVFAFGNGVGPLHGILSKALAKIAFNQLDLICVRDQASQRWLVQAGVVKSVVVTADPALLLEPSSENVAQLLAAEGIPTNLPLVAISIPPYFHDPDRWPDHEARWPEFKSSWGAVLDHLVSLGVRPVFIPMQHSPPGYALFSDLHLADMLTQGKENVFVLRKQYTPRVVAQILGTMDLVVAMRLHAVILAAVAGAPIAGVSYHHKVECFVERLGVGAFFIDVMDLESSLLVELVDRAWHSRDRLKELITSSIPELTRESAQTQRLFKEAVDSINGT